MNENSRYYEPGKTFAWGTCMLTGGRCHQPHDCRKCSVPIWTQHKYAPLLSARATNDANFDWTEYEWVLIDGKWDLRPKTVNKC